MERLKRASGGTGVSAGGVLSQVLCVCSRDLLELQPPEGEKTELQYASWGPQGNQLVSKAFTYLPENHVVIVISEHD